MDKRERIRRKIERARALVAEAHELAVDVPVVNARRGELDITVRLTGAFADAGAEWERMLQNERSRAESRAREQRELEEYGRCTKCDTGASARHLHCEACGWSLGVIGIHEGRCTNAGCRREGRQQIGIRYSSKVAA